MADVYTLNKSIGTYDHFKVQWNLVATMLKAGWIHKASSDATTKTLNSDPASCRWLAPVAIVGQSGTLASIGEQKGKDYLITGLSGLASPTKTNQGGSEGNILFFTGSATPANNTSWLITQVLSTGSCYARPLTVTTAVTSSGTTPPTMAISGSMIHLTGALNLQVNCTVPGHVTSSAARIKISLDGGLTFAPPVAVVTNSSTTTFTAEVVGSNGTDNVSGSHTGLFLYFTGSSFAANNVWTCYNNTGPDANNGSIYWTEKTYLSASYPLTGGNGLNNEWILLEGPTTLKVPFTGTLSGTFVRGENVVQAGSLAEGELLGVTYDPALGTGYAVISPRLSGNSPIYPEGWSTGLVVGATSGASLVPSGNVVRFVREVMYQKGTDVLAGFSYYQCVDDASEANQRFSWLAYGSSCTSTVGPGAGGAGTGNVPIANTFPAIAWAMVGTGGSTTAATRAWCVTNVAAAFGNAQLYGMNCIDRQGQSQDGSVMGFVGQPSVSSQSTCAIIGIYRTDNFEEGEVDPYATGGTNSGASNVQWSRTRAGAIGSSPLYSDTVTPYFMWNFTYSNQGWTQFGLGSWRRRGLPGESFVELSGLFYCWGNNWAVAYTHNNSTLADPERAASSAQSISPLLLEPIPLANPSAGTKIRKGNVRWIFYGDSTANAYDTFSNRTVIQASAMSANNLAYCATFFPWDGQTIPVQ
jgi:hypothetical protein